MLFKRRKRKPFWAHVRNFIWPSMGWSRTVDYIKHRILRLPASNHSIAFGLSSGCVVSFTPLFGFHIIQCMVLCFIGRGNYLAGLLGTTFGNPWTFPILLWLSYKVGYLTLSAFGYHEIIMIDDGETLVDDLEEKSAAIFLPTLVGSYIMALLTFPLFYLIFFFMVKSGRKAQKTLLAHRRKRKK
jgi:hypothetical protein